MSCKIAELLKTHTSFQVELDKSHRSQRELGTQLTTEMEDLRNALNLSERRAKEAEEACLQAVHRADQAVNAMNRQQQFEVETITDREVELKKSSEEVNHLTRSLLEAQRYVPVCLCVQFRKPQGVLPYWYDQMCGFEVSLLREWPLCIGLSQSIAFEYMCCVDFVMTCLLLQFWLLIYWVVKIHNHIYIA